MSSTRLRVGRGVRESSVQLKNCGFGHVAQNICQSSKVSEFIPNEPFTFSPDQVSYGLSPDLHTIFLRQSADMSPDIHIIFLRSSASRSTLYCDRSLQTLILSS